MARKILLRKPHLILLLMGFGALTLFGGEVSLALRHYSIYAPNFSAKWAVMFQEEIYREREKKEEFKNITFTLEHCACNRTLLVPAAGGTSPTAGYEATTCGRDAFTR